MSNRDQFTTIYSTGVFLQAIKCVIAGVEQWRWIAVGFEDDSYYDGELVNPVEYSDEMGKILSSFD